MKHTTYVGLDVHARSTAAAAFDPVTGEIAQRSFGNDPGDLLAWLGTLPDPACVYESGPTGFHLARFLRDNGVPCEVAAVSKLQRPAGDRRVKTDRRDAAFLARMLATNNVVAVFVPDAEAEAARDLTRLLDDVRCDLTRARQRLTHFLMHKGFVFSERTGRGTPVGTWTRAHWAWMDSIEFESALDAETYGLYKAEVRHLEALKRHVEQKVEREALKERWRARVEALSLMRGVGTVTAMAVCAEVVAFSRFEGADAFWCWCGLTPSEHSSGQGVSRGGITKAGNAHVRKLLAESAWHYAMPGSNVPGRKDSAPPRLWNHAKKGNERLSERRRHLTGDLRKHACAANAATARELAGWLWALGCMAEGTL